ncbi:MAG: hypothetical protein ICV74_04065, partial [Thermoleophilia bacterium]|nr:hypothetical protein [Thermoleophilia bacterium]
CTLVAYGGAGPMHAGAVALGAGVERVVVPALSSTFSALGCCLSELAVDDVRTFLAPLDASSWERVGRALADLVSELERELGEAGNGTVRALRSLELRYRGQNDALEVVLAEEPSATGVTASFHERHRAEYGYSTSEPVEVTAVRARLWLDEGTGWAAPEGRVGQSELGETPFGPVLARSALEPGRPVDGPAVLADAISTVVVWDGLSARADEDANVWLERSR